MKDLFVVVGSKSHRCYLNQYYYSASASTDEEAIELAKECHDASNAVISSSHLKWEVEQRTDKRVVLVYHEYWEG
jgi:hypothetical protein